MLARKSIEENEGIDQIQSTGIVGTRYLTNYPIVGQYVNGTQRGLCWAATIASMLRFEKPNLYGTITAQDIADYMGIGYDDGATLGEAKDALEHYLPSNYVPTSYSRTLTPQEIKTVIDNIDPAYMYCRRPNGFLSYKYHATALMGYNFTSTCTRVKIMDPAYETLKWCTMDSDGDWTFAFGSYTYTWKKTIRLLYV